MRAILKKVGKTPEMVDVENSLEALQKAVGGYIQAVYGRTKAGSYVIICDEEGRIKDKEPNCMIDGTDFVGDILIVGESGDGFGDLNPDVGSELCYKLDNFMPTEWDGIWVRSKG